MAKIAISDLRPTGADLFQDSESFLDMLKDDQLTQAVGGGTWSTTWTLTTIVPGTETTAATTVTTAY